jgi:ribonuclease BN (tRNA processing enzyme)
MTRDFFAMMSIDIETRIQDEGRPDPRALVTPHDLSGEGVVMHNDDVTVKSCLVRHPLIKQAYAYRFDAKDRSIVISGDTAYTPELADFAKGADILVHEVMYPSAVANMLQRVPNAANLRDHILASHSTPEDVGKIAAKAGVKTVVLTHYVPGDDDSITDAQWTEGVRKYFQGKVIAGKDLMEI